MNARSPKSASITADQLSLVKPESRCCQIVPNALSTTKPSCPPNYFSLSMTVFQGPQSSNLIGTDRLFIPAAPGHESNTHKADILLRLSPIHF